MSQSLVSIVGTTATGKTDVAFALAELVLSEGLFSEVHVLSADSRQVYRELPILSGADIPQDFLFKSTSKDFEYGFFHNQEKNVFLHGTSMLSAADEWSVALFRELALRVLQHAVKNNALVILVGGTGLYHDHVLQTDPSLLVPPDPKWRQEAVDMSVGALKELLADVSADTFEAMNNSDRNNPRRLQRAIEVAQAEPQELPQWQTEVLSKVSHTYIGILISYAQLEQRISMRVQKRLEQGVLEEVNAHKKHQENTPDSSLFSTLGYAELVRHLDGKLTLEEAVERWSVAELQYAKRQQVWWKKQPQVQWFEQPVSVSRLLETITK